MASPDSSSASRPPPDLTVVTGVGLRSPIGQSGPELVEAVRAARSGIGEIRSFDTTGLEIKHAAEIREPLFGPEAAGMFEGVDRTGVLAMLAARQAIDDSQIDLAGIAPARVALVVGVCAGGAGKSRVPLDTLDRDESWARALLRTSHYAQTSAVASYLGVHGPCVTISTACASSASALAHGWELLQQGVVDVVVAGGADAFSLFTYAGFHALGAMARRPCSPFSTNLGVSFGEGAAFVVLERAASATARGARCYGALLGYGASADCYHMTSPDPSGASLRRAMHEGLQRAGIAPAVVDYVNAHGTGTQDNDLAETTAIRALFSELPACPPVSSSKSLFGHTLGAAGALEFVVSLLCQREDLIPPTLQFEQARPGCTLDYVPNRARPASVRAFVSNSAAFGGVNVAVVGGRLDLDRVPLAAPPQEDIVISGIGLVSWLGWQREAVLRALSERVSGPSAGSASGEAFEGRVADYDLRSIARTVDPRRLDRITQLVLGAAALALADGEGERSLEPVRVGTVMAHTRGPAATEQRFVSTLYKAGISRLSPQHFPALVLSTVCGQVCQAFGLRGFTSTLVDGLGAGLHALVLAFQTLRASPHLDALLVMAGDEIGVQYREAYRMLGRLAEPGRAPAPYASDAGGTALGEGAAALLIERRSSAERRGAKRYAVLAGAGTCCDGVPGNACEPEGKWLVEAIRTALLQAGLSPELLQLVYGHGRGIAREDTRELSALRAVLGDRPVPIGCLTGHTGLLEAASGLFSTAAAALSIQNGLAFPIASHASMPSGFSFVRGSARPGHYDNVLVTASTEYGNNAALVLTSECGGTTA